MEPIGDAWIRYSAVYYLYALVFVAFGVAAGPMGIGILDISVDTMARLAKIPNIVGVKDATGDLDRDSADAVLDMLVKLRRDVFALSRRDRDRRRR